MLSSSIGDNLTKVRSNCAKENKHQSLLSCAINNSKKSLTRTSNRELFEILETYSKNTTSNQPGSQTSLNQNAPFVNTTSSVLKDILTKETHNLTSNNNKINQKPEIKLPKEYKKSLYLVKPKSPVPNEKEKKKPSLTKTKKQLHKTKPVVDKKIKAPIKTHPITNNNKSDNSKCPYFNLRKFKCQKLEEMENECSNLEKKIEILKKDLSEMEHCLVLMKNIKENFKNEFQSTELDMANNNTSRKSITDLESFNMFRKSLESMHQRTLKESYESSSIKINTENSLLKDKEKNETSKSNISQISECTWVSSSFINEISYNIQSDSSRDDKNPSKYSSDIDGKMNGNDYQKHDRANDNKLSDLVTDLNKNIKYANCESIFKKIWKKITVKKLKRPVHNLFCSDIKSNSYSHNNNLNNNIKYTRVFNATNKDYLSNDGASSQTNYYSATDKTVCNHNNHNSNNYY